MNIQCDILDELYRGIAEELKSRGDYSYIITNTREIDAFCSVSLACMEILWQDGAVLVTINLEEACIYVREKVAWLHSKRNRYSDKVASKMELYDDKFFEKIHNILLINNINNTTSNKLRVGGGK